MPTRKIKEYLDSYGVEFQSLPHAPAYTAAEIAAAAHVPGRELAKSVMVRIDGQLALVAVPANSQVSLDRVRAAAGATTVTLADEREFRDLFPDCEPGAMPPLGNLYGIPVYADEALAADPQIAFNAGSHTELVRLSFADFARLAKPIMGRFAEEPYPIHG